MIIYILNFISIIAYGFLIKNKKQLCTLIGVQLFLILAFRADCMGVDWTTYRDHFEYWKDLPFSTIISSFRWVGSSAIPWGNESGYVLFNWIIANLGLDFHALLVICAAISVFSMTRFIYQYSDNPIISFCVFITLGGYELFFGILRQSLGLAIFLFAIPAIKERKFWKYLILVMCANLFHISYLLTIPVYFLSSLKMKKTYYWGVTAASIIMIPVIPIVFKTIIMPVLTILKKKYELGGFQWNNLFLLIILLAVFIGIFYKEKIHKGHYSFSWFLLSGLVIQVLSFYVSTFSRAVIGIFLPFLYILLANTIEGIKQRQTRLLVKMVMYAAMFFAYVYLLQGSFYVPYISVFNE